MSNVRFKIMKNTSVRIITVLLGMALYVTGLAYIGVKVSNAWIPEALWLGLLLLLIGHAWAFWSVPDQFNSSYIRCGIRIMLAIFPAIISAPITLIIYIFAWEQFGGSI